MTETSKNDLPADSGKYTISEAAAALGRRGGLARAKSLTPERRKEIGSKAIAARWKKRRRKAK